MTLILTTPHEQRLNDAQVVQGIPQHKNELSYTEDEDGILLQRV